MHDTDPPDVLDRQLTPRGELVLRRTGEHYEVVSNGAFLMDTRDGRSERALVDEALGTHGAPRSLLIGGLGVGFSLCAAVAHAALERIVVVEVEQRVVDWHATHLAHLTAAALADRRVEVVVADVGEVLAASQETYDVVCLDVDNGPDWTVTDDNTRLYAAEGLGQVHRALRPGGVLAVWAARPVPGFESRLREQYDRVRLVEVPPAVPRAAPDVVYLARRP
jgi:spermidine synthase